MTHAASRRRASSCLHAELSREVLAARRAGTVHHSAAAGGFDGGMGWDEAAAGRQSRSIPAGLAAVVERLELVQPRVVTTAELAGVAGHVGDPEDPAGLARRLRRAGWLRTTGCAGVWEFVPAAYAGAASTADPTIGVRAWVARHPGVEVALALDSALWARGLVDRPPDRPIVSVPRAGAASTLGRFASVTGYRPRLRPEALGGEVPVQRLESVVVHAAERPRHVADWGSFGRALVDVVDEADLRQVRHEVAGRPRSVQARLAYLLQALAPTLARELGRGAGKVWFGPRGRLRRHSARFQVADTLLPFHPASLGVEVPGSGDLT